MMKIDVLLGLQWGDEGKGKVVDVLSPNYDIVARFQGGPNAGHTLIFNEKKYVLHLIPSGIFREKTINVIGNGVVLDPAIFKEEVINLEKEGLNLHKNLYISKKTHLIIPTHRILDAYNEKQKAEKKIGSTLKGIGPAYTDKISRNGLRVGDLNCSNFMEKYETLKKSHLSKIDNYEYKAELEKYEKEWFSGIEKLKEFTFIDGEKFFNDALKNNKKILAEGAQGTLLDIDFGTYPFVTSSSTTTAGVCTGLGVSPAKIGEVFGIFKSYTTRVGSGPFPTELFDEDGENLQKFGFEFGATTGRKRRCGWLDLTALKYSAEINGVTQFVMTKADVLSNFNKIKVSESYTKNGEIFDYIPYEFNDDLKPNYKEFKCWKKNLTECKDYNSFPTELKEYILYIEKETGIPVKIISTGADRNDIVKQ